MADVRYRLDPANPPRLSDRTKSYLDALTDEQIDAAALADPDALPATPAMLASLWMQARLPRVRERLGLTQAAFAARYRLNPVAVAEWEDGRRLPDEAARALVAIIDDDADYAARVIGAAAEHAPAAE